MAILRSRASSNASYQVQNASVNAAIREWESRIEAARAEGVEAGLQQAQEQLAEAQALQHSVDEKLTAMQQDAEQKIKQQQDHWHAEWGRILASLHEAMDEVSSLEKQAVASSERVIVQLASRMAAHILQKEISEDQDWLIPIIQRAIYQIPDKRSIQIRLHPLDAEHLETQKQRLVEHIQQQVEIEVQGDEQLARGSLILESDGTYIDASLSSNWERLQEHMLDQAPDADWSTPAVIGPEDVQFVADVEANMEANSQDSASDQGQNAEEIVENTEPDEDVGGDHVEP